MPLINILFRELSTTYLHDINCLALILRCRFKFPILVTVKNKSYEFLEFNLFAPRRFKKKKRFMQVTGNAFYDWETNKAIFPDEGSTFSIHGIKPDMPDWDDYEGKIPELGNFQWIINRYWGCLDLKKAKIPQVPIYKIFVERILPALDITQVASY